MADSEITEPKDQCCSDPGSVQAHAIAGEAANAHENDDEDVGVSDSGSEMSLSPVEDTPIVHSSDNGDKSRTQTNQLVYAPDEDLRSSSKMPAIGFPVIHNYSQLDQASDPLPRTGLDLCNPRLSNPKPVSNRTIERSRTVNQKDKNTAHWDNMTKPVKPSPLRQSVTSRQIQDQPETINALAFTNIESKDPKPSTSTSGQAVHPNTNHSQASTSELDEFALPTVNEDTGLQPLSTSTESHTSSVAARDTPSTRATNVQPTPDTSSDIFGPIVSPNPTVDTAVRERNVFNKRRDGEVVMLVNQPIWRQANLTLKSGIASTSVETQRRGELRRDRAYQKSIEAAEPLFNEGGNDHMLNGCEVGENRVGESDDDLWTGDVDFGEMIATKNRIVEKAAFKIEIDEAQKESHKKDDSSDNFFGELIQGPGKNED